MPAYGTDVTPPRGANVEACNTIWGGMAVTQAKNLDYNIMYCRRTIESKIINQYTNFKIVVNALAVLPGYQRQGLGTRILRVCTDLADHDGLKTYIEASAAGAPLYRRLGWDDIPSEKEKGSESGLKYMLRNRSHAKESRN